MLHINLSCPLLGVLPRASLKPLLRHRHRPSRELYLQHFPSAVEMLQGAGVLHGQMDVRDCQLVGQIINVLHALFHLGQLLLEQLQACEKEPLVQTGLEGHGRADQI